MPIHCNGCKGEGGHVGRHVDTWPHKFAQSFSKNPATTNKSLSRRKGRAKTHDDIGGCEVDEIDVDGGPHMLAPKDHVEYQHVPAHPHHEDDHVQADEDCLHPWIKNVVLHITATNSFKFTDVR